MYWLGATVFGLPFRLCTKYNSQSRRRYDVVFSSFSFLRSSFFTRGSGLKDRLRFVLKIVETDHLVVTLNYEDFIDCYYNALLYIGPSPTGTVGNRREKSKLKPFMN